MASLKKERTVGIPVLFRGESLLQNVVSECRNMAQLSVLLFLVKYWPNFVDLLTSGSLEGFMKHDIGCH
jgi:hypothetical protein